MKTIIYQALPRLFGNTQTNPQPHGTIGENGCGKFNHFTPAVLRKIRRLGVTHLWYTGVLAHASRTDYSRYGIAPSHPALVKGEAGSPYAIRDYYDVDPDLAVDVSRRMDEFDALVERTHREGMGVLIDFVPNHVARQYRPLCQPSGTEALGATDDPSQAFSPGNNFYYLPQTPLQLPAGADGAARAYAESPARVTGNDCFCANPAATDWYETVKLNYGVDYTHGRAAHFSPIPSTWEKMLHILLFWADRGIDGFRCDMAEMVPVEFWEWALPQVRDRHPDVLFVAEVYNPQLYRDYIRRGGFDYLYDKVGLYDTLMGVMRGYRPAGDISRCWQDCHDILPHMLAFLENHDEMRLASPHHIGQARAAIPALVTAVMMGTAPFMLYAGQELGEAALGCQGFSGDDGRTTIFDYWSLDTLRRRYGGGSARLLPAQRDLLKCYERILGLAQSEAALREGQFFDLTYANTGAEFNPHRRFAFLRKAEREVVLVVANFDAAEAQVDVHIPAHAFACLQLPSYESLPATDLLSQQEECVNLLPYAPVRLSVPGHGARVLKFVV